MGKAQTYVPRDLNRAGHSGVVCCEDHYAATDSVRDRNARGHTIRVRHGHIERPRLPAHVKHVMIPVGDDPTVESVAVPKGELEVRVFAQVNRFIRVVAVQKERTARILGNKLEDVFRAAHEVAAHERIFRDVDRHIGVIGKHLREREAAGENVNRAADAAQVARHHKDAAARLDEVRGSVLGHIRDGGQNVGGTAGWNVEGYGILIRDVHDSIEYR